MQMKFGNICDQSNVNERGKEMKKKKIIRVKPKKEQKCKRLTLIVTSFSRIDSL